MNSFRVTNESQPVPLSLNPNELESLGLPYRSRIEFTPVNSTYFFMRMENLEDHFEHHRSLSVQYVDLDKLSAHFTRKIYHNLPAPAGFNIQIDEMSLTGN